MSVWRGRIRGALLACALAGLVRAACAQALPPEVARPLAAVGVGEKDVAIVALDANGAPRLSLNAERAMNPASVMKLVTTYSALGMLGPAYTWKTAVYANGPIEGGTLRGDLFIEGSGDPKLTQERLWLLLRELRARGVRKIAGDVVLDRRLFDVQASDPARFDNQPLRAYNVAPDALLVHFKALELRFVPQPGAVAVLAEPGLEGLTVESHLKPVAGGCDNWRAGLRYAFEEGRRARLKFDGTYPALCGEKTWMLGVLDHPGFVRGVFGALWAELGGKLSGRVREGERPEGARVIASTESPPLAEIVRDVNKWSNNVMARQLMLSLAVAEGARPARESAGAAAIAGWLARQGLAMPELVLENGAGLSRIERVSAGSLSRLLVGALASPVMPEYLASLPIGGVDGTMQRRLNQDEAAGRARIKTGTLDGVRAMAGYVQNRAGQQQVVVMLINHPNANSREVREAEDALLRWMYSNAN